MRKGFNTAALAVLISLSASLTAFAGTWLQDPARPAAADGTSNWYYQNEDGSRLKDGWFWIDGNGDRLAEYYRFDGEGWLFTSTKVDDSPVNEDGAWTPSSYGPRFVYRKSTLTDAEAYEKILALKNTYPEGMAWTDDSASYQTTVIQDYKDNAYIKKPFSSSMSSSGCAAFVLLVQDSVFGPGAVKSHYETFDWNSIRVGDHLRINQDGHSVIVLTVEPDAITICEGNYNSSIHWGRRITKERLEQIFTYRETCY